MELLIKGDEIGYISREDDQSFGLFCPVVQIYDDAIAAQLVDAWNSKASPASVPEGFTMSEPAILPDGSGFGTMTEREATLLGKVAQQSAALKLAREALFDMQDSYAAVHGWKDSFVIAATTAIAAIDALGEVK